MCRSLCPTVHAVSEFISVRLRYRALFSPSVYVPLHSLIYIDFFFVSLNDFIITGGFTESLRKLPGENVEA